MKTLDWSMTKIVKYPFNNFYKEETEKRIVFIHYTAGGSAKEAINWWNARNLGQGTVATCDVIDRDGTIYEAFDSKYWAYHLGAVGEVPSMIGSTELNKISVGIEMVAFGHLRFDGEKYWSWTGKEIDAKEVVCFEDGYRSEHYFQDFTEAQYQALFERLDYYCDLYNIPKKDYSHGFGYFSEMPLLGITGIYCHSMVTFRKLDCPPFPKLIKVLKSLEVTEPDLIVTPTEKVITNSEKEKKDGSISNTI